MDLYSVWHSGMMFLNVDVHGFKRAMTTDVKSLAFFFFALVAPEVVGEATRG